MSAYAYPLCHGVPTVLRSWGWYCAGCGQYLPFRDDAGRTYAERQAAEKGADGAEKKTRRKEKGRVL